MTVYIPAFSPDTLEMLTPVSNTPSVLPFTNPVKVYVKAGSVAPYTFEIPEVAITVNGAGEILADKVGCVSVYFPASIPVIE